MIGILCLDACIWHIFCTITCFPYFHYQSDLTFNPLRTNLIWSTWYQAFKLLSHVNLKKANHLTPTLYQFLSVTWDYPLDYKFQLEILSVPLSTICSTVHENDRAEKNNYGIFDPGKNDVIFVCVIDAVSEFRLIIPDFPFDFKSVTTLNTPKYACIGRRISCDDLNIHQCHFGTFPVTFQQKSFTKQT